MRILHILPRWIGGGPERGVLAAARHDAEDAAPIVRRVLVLDRPVSAPLFVQARRAGVAVQPLRDRDHLAEEVAAADLVQIAFWNHPALYDLLRRPWPAARVLLDCVTAGDTLPHILTDEVLAFVDAVWLSTPEGAGAAVENTEARPVLRVPSLADMTRLDGARVRDGAAPGAVRAAYLGSLAPAKLHPAFAEIVAATRTPGFGFDLYGDADPESIARLRAELSAHGCTDRVRIHGHVEDIAAALSGADIFAYSLAPGSYVTSEKALQEAMWIGLPPVLIEGTAATGWIAPGRTGFVLPDVADMAAALDLLAGDAELRAGIGAAARVEARARFDPGPNAARMRAFARDLCARPKRPRPPLPGAGLPPSERFLASLGPMAGRFLDVVEGRSPLSTPTRWCNPDILRRGEGGLIHHAKTYPDDGHFRAWADALGKRGEN